MQMKLRMQVLVQFTLLFLVLLCLPPTNLASPDQNEEIRQSIETLKSKRSFSHIDRQTTARRLTEIGGPAVPTLIEALRGDDPVVRDWAWSAPNRIYSLLYLPSSRCCIMAVLVPRKWLRGPWEKWVQGQKKRFRRSFRRCMKQVLGSSNRLRLPWRT